MNVRSVVNVVNVLNIRNVVNVRIVLNVRNTLYVFGLLRASLNIQPEGIASVMDFNISDTSIISFFERSKFD